MFFLCMYFAVIAAAIFFVRAFVGHLDESSRLAVPVIGARTCVLELAYLRGGRRAVLEATLARLQARGLLAVAGRCVARADGAERGSLDDLERAVYDATAFPKPIAEVAAICRDALRAEVDGLDVRLRGEELFTSLELRSRTRLLSLFCTILIACAGLALGTTVAGRLVAGPLLTALAGSFGILALWMCGRVPRLSDRGRRYVAALDAAFPEAAKPRSFPELPTDFDGCALADSAVRAPAT